MTHLIKAILVILATLFSVACGTESSPSPADGMGGTTSEESCLQTQGLFGFGYSSSQGELLETEPGQALCYTGARQEWCLYFGSEASDGTNLIGPDAVADSGNDEGCAPGFEGMGMGGSLF